MTFAAVFGSYNTLIEPVVFGAVDPLQVLAKVEPMRSAIDAYRAFDRREPGWLKVELKPAVQAA